MTLSTASQNIAASNSEESASVAEFPVENSAQPSGPPTTTNSKADAMPPQSSSSTSLPSCSTTSSLPSTSNLASTERPPKLGPPPKKRKSMLSSKGSATAAAGKPTKLNTLEKSKLDWESFKKAEHSKSQLKDGDTGGRDDVQALTEEERAEMESQTRAGGSARSGKMSGFLDRADFLDRVSERMEAAAEDEKRKMVTRRP
ncbi:hypothetical protein CF326_g7246 [Tilletia indica]|nr:hypothetical protein CF326_g7246 [Tilletia indica]